MDTTRKSLWTNNPEWQDQETGETTPEGTAHLMKKNQLALKEKNMASKFAKKDETTKEAKGVKTPKADKAVTKKEDKSSKKAAAKKAPKADKTEKADDTRKITVLTKTNPKREGSKAHGTFSLYAKSKTVADFIKAGGSMADIRFDEKAGHIKVA